LTDAVETAPRARRRTVIVWGRWLGAFGLLSLVFSRMTTDVSLRPSHGLLAYLLLIVGAAREARRGLSTVMVILSYLAVDWYFVPPRHEFGQTNNLDFYILAGFVIVAATISHLVSSLKTAAMLATERAERIALLGDQQLRLEREAVRTRETREAEAMKNALIASIAHDLRSPITTVKMLADPEYGIDPAVALRRIGDEADRINRYLSTMRHFSDVGTTGVLMNVESHVVDDLIGTAIASYASALRAREVRVTQEPGTRILLLRCDLTLSLQVLGNLLQNAARYSPASTPIDVWTVSDGAFGRIVVADRGPGVLPEDVERIFKPRERGASASVDGQGMGLAIARTFARAQLGDVVYVAREGGGSEFSFVLPRSTELAS
jgi:K+-sensing histidine kinase KdpD